MKKNQDNFFRDISDILTQARNRAGKAVNLVMVYSCFEVGKRIAEEEQNGEARAQYGTRLIQELSNYLTNHIGPGFSVTNLKHSTLQLLRCLGS